jgi:hypothetical protein
MKVREKCFNSLISIREGDFRGKIRDYKNILKNIPKNIDDG